MGSLTRSSSKKGKTQARAKIAGPIPSAAEAGTLYLIYGTAEAVPLQEELQILRSAQDDTFYFVGRFLR